MRFFQRIGSALTRFMYGRNGMDQLNRALFLLYLLLGLAGVVCELLFRNRFRLVSGVFEGLLFVLLLFVFMRMFSRNLPRRQAENQKWVNWVWRVKNRNAGAKARHADKEHKYFTCKACKTICRVPVGKGSIIITCPKCGAKIKAKT